MNTDTTKKRKLQEGDDLETNTKKTKTCKTHLEQLLDQIPPSFDYTFEDGCLRIQSFRKNFIDNIRTFVTLLEQNTTPIISLDLSSNFV
jgi:uncharacterized protein YecE (DUF72 family)